MSFPLAQTVQHEPYIPGAVDSHGNPIRTWGPPVDVEVYGWSSPSSTEPKMAGHDRVIVDVEVYAPSTWIVHAHDHVTVGGTVHDVIGEPEDYNHGPFRWKPGIVVNLQRVKG